MKITIIGTGYVGLITGVGLADFGNTVICVDVNSEKISTLRSGDLPFYEPGVEAVLRKNLYEERLAFSENIISGIDEADIIFISVGTPQKQNGDADLSSVFNVANLIGENINKYTIIVTKSTVPVGTNKEIKGIIEKKLKDRGVESDVEFDIVSNPEFLREGRALYDFMHPDRVVVGTDSERPIETIKRIYRPLYLSETPFVFTDLRTAELIKYSANCFLATKVAYINEISRLCDAVGADIKTVAYAMGKDERIGGKFLHPGPGYGGSCFPKDTEALAHLSRQYNVELQIVQSVIQSNQRQKQYAANKIRKNLSNIEAPIICILGVSFKSETDDIRESAAIDIINELLLNDIQIRLYDPQAMMNAKKIWGDRITYCENEYEAAKSAHGIAIITEWNQFRNLNLHRLSEEMFGNKFFDLRNIYEPNEVKQAGFLYFGIGRA